MIKIASLALAAALLSSAAHAQTPINIQGIDTPAGAERFDRDLKRATFSICKVYRGVRYFDCRDEVRTEALSLLPAEQRNAYLSMQAPRSVRYAANNSARS